MSTFVHQNGIQLIVPDQLILPITQAKQSMFNFIWKKEVGIKEYRMTVCSMNYSIVTIIIKGWACKGSTFRYKILYM